LNDAWYCSTVARLRPASNNVCASAGPTDQKRLGQVSQSRNDVDSNPAPAVRVTFGKNAAVAIPPDRRPAAVGQRAVVLDDALQRFPGQIEPVEFGIAMLQRGDDAQGLGVVIEPAMGLQAGIQRPLAGVAERRMAEVMGQGQGLREILIEAELPGQRTGDLRHFERVAQAGAVMIAFVEHEYLGFVLQAAKCGGMDHPVAIAPERAAGLARRLGEQPPAAAVGVAGKDRARSSHSDRHGVLSPKGLIPVPGALNYALRRIPDNLDMASAIGDFVHDHSRHHQRAGRPPHWGNP